MTSVVLEQFSVIFFLTGGEKSYFKGNYQIKSIMFYLL